MSGSGRAVTVEVADVRAPDDSPGVIIDVERWAALAQAVLDAEGAGGSLGLTFVDAAEIAGLNEEHMGKQGPTDVLSFPIDGVDDPGEPEPGGRTDEVPRLLGDVVVSPAVAEHQYAVHAGSIEDELALLVVHGVLHVLGHDHAEQDETERMRAAELRHLERFHWRGPAPAGFRHDHADS